MKNIREKSLEFFGLIKSGAGMLIFANVFANVSNFIFSAYIGRHLSLDDFATVTMVGTFVYIMNFFIGSISTTVCYSVSYLEGVGKGNGSVFFKKTWLQVFIPSIISCFIWIFFVPVIGHFLNVNEYSVIFYFAPALFFGSMSAYNGGYLQGTWSFDKLAFLAFFEAVSKLIIAIVFVLYGFSSYVALAIPISIGLTWFGSTIASYLVYRDMSLIVVKSKETKEFSFSFYFASLMRGFSTVVFLSMDIILAKHFLNPTDAGIYSLLSIVGKMIYFFGALLNVFIVPFISRFEGEHQNPEKEFIKLFSGTAFLSISAGLGVSTLGWFLIPFLLGQEASVVIPYLPMYSLAMTLFTLTTTIVLYQLARKHYIFPAISMFMSFGMLFAIYLEHSSINEFVEAIAKVNIVYFLLVVFVYFSHNFIVYTIRNLSDFFVVFKKLPEAKVPSNGKKKILIFNWRDTKSVYAGGAEVYIHNIASRWVKDGHSVTLFTSNDGKLPRNGETDGVRVIRRGGFFAVYIIAPIYYLFHFRGKFDVIVDSENGIPFFTPLYAKEPIYCLVYHIHQEVFIKSLIWPLAKFACFLEKDLMPLVYKNHNFITISESSKKDMELLKITDKEIKIVNPGIDTDFLTPGIKSEIPTISYVGRLQEHKSVYLLIKAFKEVINCIPGARLLIAGDGEEKYKLQRLIKRLGISGSVDFRGKVSEEEKRDILRKSWVFVTPSMFEGWGITTIEANACGTPVIASDVQGLRDSVQNGQTGFLFPYGKTDILTENITKILKNQNLRLDLSDKSIQWAKKFNWDISANNFLSIIVGNN